MNYSEMTVDELQEYADNNNIDLDGAKRKAAIIRAIEAASSKGEDEVELVDKDNELDPTVEAVPEPEEASTEDATTEPEEAPTEEVDQEPEEAPVSDSPKSRKIRALKDPALSAIPILAMTANAFDEDRKKAVKCGMNGFLSKPINIEEIFKELRTVFEKE